MYLVWLTSSPALFLTCLGGSRGKPDPRSVLQHPRAGAVRGGQASGRLHLRPARLPLPQVTMGLRQAVTRWFSGFRVRKSLFRMVMVTVIIKHSSQHTVRTETNSYYCIRVRWADYYGRLGTFLGVTKPQWCKLTRKKRVQSNLQQAATAEALCQIWSIKHGVLTLGKPSEEKIPHTGDTNSLERCR